MPSRLHRWPKARGGLFAYLAVVALASLYFLHRFHADFGGLQPFWDARVYARALQRWRVGLNPYASAALPRSTAVLPFVSPPAFLYLMGLLRHVFPGRLGFGVYCAVASLCTLAVPTLLAMFYVRSRWMSPALAVFITWFQPGKHGSQALLTGNVSNVLYAALLAAGVPGLRRQRWLPFYVVMVVAGLLKPPFLAFLLLPLLAGERQWRGSAGAVLAVLAGDLAQKLTSPGLWSAFQHGVFLRVFVRGDAGFGLLGQLTAWGQHVHVPPGFSPSLMYLMVIAPLLLLMFLFRERRFGRAAERLWVPGLVLLAVLSNPRILDYDANVATVPAVFSAVEFLLSLPPGQFRGLGIGVSLLLWLGLEVSHAETALCVLFVAAVLMVICQLIWPHAFQRPGQEIASSSVPAGSRGGA